MSDACKQRGCAHCHWTVHLKMAKMAYCMFTIFLKKFSQLIFYRDIEFYTRPAAAAAAAKSLQSCPTLCDPTDGSPPGSSAPGILQARILEWVAISFSNAWKWKVKVKSLSHVRLLATPWTAAYQAPPSGVGFWPEGCKLNWQKSLTGEKTCFRYIYGLPE